MTLTKGNPGGDVARVDGHGMTNATKEKSTMKTPSWRLPSFGYQNNERVGLWVTIYPPGTWFDRPGFHCFVGGGGVGEADTLEEAIDKVQQSALARLEDQRLETLNRLSFIQEQIDTIEREGWDVYREEDKEYE